MPPPSSPLFLKDQAAKRTFSEIRYSLSGNLMGGIALAAT